MKSVKIKGKDYVMVDERLKEFRKNFEGYGLITNIIELDEKSVTIRAVITDKENKEIASGIAREEKSDGFINKTSYVENCETSAWGRALANLGIGIDTGVASAEEVENAIEQQTLIKAKKLNINFDKLATYLKKNKSELTTEDIEKAIEQKGGK